MTREEKDIIVKELSEKFSNTNFFYLTDASTMSVAGVNKFRRLCFEKGIEYKVYKNSLIKKALEANNIDTVEISPALKGFTGVMFAAENASIPAKILVDFRKKGNPLPLLKAAYVDSSIYLGDNQLDALSKIKSKEELVGEIIGLLQSPAKNVISALKGQGGKIAGILKTLSEKE